MRIARGVVLMILLSTSPVAGQSISIGFDPSCLTCSADVQIGAPFTLYVTASEIGGIWEGWGIGGAEFRLLGLPQEWIILTRSSNPNTSIVIGDPLGDGTNIALYPGSFGACVNLFTFTILPTSIVQDHYLRIARHASISNPMFPCPVLASTDCGPAPRRPASICAECASGGQAILNPSGPACTVALLPRTWAQVKRLFD